MYFFLQIFKIQLAILHKGKVFQHGVRKHLALREYVAARVQHEREALIGRCAAQRANPWPAHTFGRETLATTSYDKIHHAYVTFDFSHRSLSARSCVRVTKKFYLSTWTSTAVEHGVFPQLCLTWSAAMLLPIPNLPDPIRRRKTSVGFDDRHEAVITKITILTNTHRIVVKEVKSFAPFSITPNQLAHF